MAVWGTHKHSVTVSQGSMAEWGQFPQEERNYPPLTSHYSHCLTLPVCDSICEREIKQTGKTVENQIKPILKCLRVAYSEKKNTHFSLKVWSRFSNHIVTWEVKTFETRHCFINWKHACIILLRNLSERNIKNLSHEAQMPPISWVDIPACYRILEGFLNNS